MGNRGRLYNTGLINMLAKFSPIGNAVNKKKIKIFLSAIILQRFVILYLFISFPLLVLSKIFLFDI